MSTPVRILGVNVDPLTAPEAMVTLRERLDRGERQFVVTVNPEIITAAAHDDGYQAIVNSASLRLTDGVGVRWAARFLEKPGGYGRAFRLLVSLALSPSRFRSPLPETIPGSDLAVDIAGMCEEFDHPVFLLGGGPGVAEKAAAVLVERFPCLTLAGFEEGGRGQAADDERLRDLIQTSGAHVVLVAYGAPKQERWIARNLSSLPAPLLAIGVGGTFDYWAGTEAVAGGKPAKSPPAWVRRRGFEWLWRLVTQPSRGKRIAAAFPLFVRRVVRSSKN